MALISHYLLTQFLCMRLVFRCFFFFFQAEDGIRDLVRSRGLGDVYKRQVEGIERGLDPQAAAQAALAFLAQRTGGWAGLIVLSRQGQVAAAFNSVAMTHAWWRSDMIEPTVVA